jgi:hypothetical protein
MSKGGDMEEDAANVTPKKNRVWFLQKVAEMKVEFDKLSPNRQEQLRIEMQEWQGRKDH